MRYPAVAARPFVYIADGGKRHVKTRGEKLIARKHIEDTLARCHRFFFVIVHFEMPFWSLHGHHILRAGVGGNHETLSPALYMERQQTRRMACGIYGGKCRHDLAPPVFEGLTVSQWHADFHKQFTIKLARLSHVLAALPEIELGGPKYITRIRKNWLIAFNQAPNVVGVSMCDDNNVDVLWHVSRSRESRDHLSGRKSLAELLIFARKRAVAGVEQHQLLAGVHKRWNIGMLEPSGVDIVGSRKRLYFVSGGISTVMRCSPSRIALASRTVATSNPPSLKW